MQCQFTFFISLLTIHTAPSSPRLLNSVHLSIYTSSPSAPLALHTSFHSLPPPSLPMLHTLFIPTPIPAIGLYTSTIHISSPSNFPSRTPLHAIVHPLFKSLSPHPPPGPTLFFKGPPMIFQRGGGRRHHLWFMVPFFRV